MLPKLPIAILSFVFCLLSFHVSTAQQGENNQNQTLNQQYNSLIENSETFNDYKVIKRNKLTDFWEVVNDSITLVNKSRREANTTIETKKNQIQELNSVIQQKDQELATGQEEKSTLIVLGVKTNKSSYAIISIIIPFVLLIIIGFLAVKSRIDSQTTKSAKQHLSSIEKEYEDYKKRALDNQVKLNRELQTERNKLLELTK